MVHPGIALCASTSPSRSVKADAAVFGVEFLSSERDGEL